MEIEELIWRNKYAFIDYDDYSSAENALTELHGTQLDGYNKNFVCNIEWSNKKETPAHIRNILNHDKGSEAKMIESNHGGKLNLVKDRVYTINPHFNACYIWNKSGHFAKSCPNKVVDKSEYECFKCNK